MERSKLLLEINELLSTYCGDCLVKAALRKEYHKTYAHQFCIQKCTVGEQLKELGKQLTYAHKR
ncbi:zinc-finger domain-containing protein [Heyndrickxia sporothermodurans]|uniref:Zinc-finger domain-containing protein n=1 Tax=Heyndrickxia sporothermodurans TaxID=46224 RepID=A0AB37HE73_9BACI|nr:zinc-finger domain-containing protein [Heyndrickxia sporothermodurans]MBL5767054.1 zinc-finger domain-containing protein [Heyndrickxia sporothermodurans]MBL5770501.1 zinc-finger domain-containing protein [Heyndrickxia sporothermodurans]MBL5774190.1 zinc-finger domain-containing protein [Heyndrickxia sporothermodurans]MBL5779501.1 zinc-finger domain-containing protein [Heyndrickxia sporothermodurans]MBL5782965.1 zinc-finger domain-containing protein [Heyndrickxia sporothermodurans]